MLLNFSDCPIDVVFGNNVNVMLVNLRTFFKTTISTNQKYQVKSLQAYLEERGLLVNLENSNLKEDEKLLLKEQITQAKAEHRRLYLKEKRKEYNEKQARVELRLNKVGRGNEYDKFQKKAKGKKLATFIKSCATAYLKNEYIVPDEKVIDALIKEISLYREDRNKEGRNIKFILDRVRRQGMVYPNDMNDLHSKMYALEKLDFTFDLEQSVINAMQHPEEHFFEYVERHIQKTPEAIEKLEKIISKYSKVKAVGNDNQE